MSVINKMLRDLDSRQADTDVLASLGAVRPGRDGVPTGARVGLSAGRATVAGGVAQPVRARRSTRTVVQMGMYGVLALAGVAAAAWWLLHRPTPPVAVAPPAATQPAPLTVAAQAAPPAVAAQVASVVPAAAPTSATRAAATVAPPLVVSVAVVPKADNPAARPALSLATASSVRPAPVAAQVVPPPPALAGSLSLKLSMDAAPPLNQMVTAAVPTTAHQSVQPLAASVAPAAALQPAAGKPATLQALLLHAQTLWGDGDRSAALQLLKDAMQRLESAPGGQGDAATVALVREYARVGLLGGQTTEVLVTLERLQPQWAGVADIWAIRGNAAQRLGRHAQAVAAYQQALALNPNEPRWMLGAAVSMAALGQTGPAADLAEKVRSARALPPDVANYLRQLGVAIRAD